jgi:probable DNA metabolism protein
MNYSLIQMFDRLNENVFSQQPIPADKAADDAIIAGLYSAAGLDLSALPAAACGLFELSVNAFDAFVHAWMSELPIQAETLRFGRRVLAAGSAVIGNAARLAAGQAAVDRGDPDTLIVLQAAYKVQREVDRLRGLLRFSPNEEGVYLARCEPDHYILPALGEHFTPRFGDTPWIVIDEKRGISIGRPDPVPASGGAAGDAASDDVASDDAWESLWKQYHHTINNESRNNPRLQRQFMPVRYHKYLPEL